MSYTSICNTSCKCKLCMTIWIPMNPISIDILTAECHKKTINVETNETLSYELESFGCFPVVFKIANTSKLIKSDQILITEYFFSWTSTVFIYACLFLCAFSLLLVHSEKVWGDCD